LKRRWEMLFLPREEGQGLTEYGMIIVLVAIVVVLVLVFLGPAVGNLFSAVVEAI
jgi:pilus assembly protein Flp/PilA